MVLAARGNIRTMNIADTYANDGLVTGIDVLDPDQVAHYRAAWDQLEEQIGRDKAQIGVIGKHREHDFIWQLATHRAILDCIEQVVGPDIVLLGTHFFCKYPAKGSEAFVAWHQDVTYWGLKPPKSTTAWLAIDDVDIENGAMRVVPGTHKLGLLEHTTSDREGNLLSANQAIDERRFDPATAVDIALRAGQMSLHDGMTVHGSNPNNSNRRRCGLTLRYITPDVQIHRDPNRPFTWQPSVVRGEDRRQLNEYLPAPVFA